MRVKIVSLLASAVLAAAIAGCKATSSHPSFYDGDRQSESTLASGFADEKYVWESFHPTTNRINGSKR